MTTYQAAVAVGLFAFMATSAGFVFAHNTNGRKTRSFFPGVLYGLGILMLPGAVAGGIVAAFWESEPFLAIILASWGYFGAFFVSVRLLDKALVSQAALQGHRS